MNSRKRYGIRRVPLRLIGLYRRARAEAASAAAARAHRSFDAMAAIFGWLMGLVRAELPGFELRDSDVLEVGSGKFLAHAAVLRVCGCRSVVTVDRYRQATQRAFRASLKSPILARRFLSALVSHDEFVAGWARLAATGFDLERLSEAGIEYRAPLDVAGWNGEGRFFDFIFSYTVLEHVPPGELPALLSGLSKLLKPDGVCVHFIDLEDHRRPMAEPFAFLAPTAAWSEADCGSRGNRLRFSSWRRMLGEQEGIDWRFPYTAVRRDAELPAPIDPRVEYIDEEDLRTTACVAVGTRRRPA